MVQHPRGFAEPRPSVDTDGMMRFRASKQDCEACALKPNCYCCSVQPMCKIACSIYERARDLASDLAQKATARSSQNLPCERSRSSDWLPEPGDGS
ncbi:hypothetical protein SPHV1_1350003 [Novosphingobium sp. KN65.2]|nr:hypothetical protein SPHV1_1350003 [Novosphingobium sp. KN65.2]